MLELPKEILKKILESHFKGTIIDEKSGNSGNVYIVDKGKNNEPRYIAFKSIKFKNELDDGKRRQFIDESEKWMRIKNPYIITPFYSLVLHDVPFVCMPYCDIDLKTLMLSKNLNYSSALNLSVQLVKALLVLRQRGIDHHQDLNPPNILLVDLKRKFPTYPDDNLINYDVKISDFGIADLIKKIGPTKGGGGGKFPFKAPEQYFPKDFQGYNPDLFALGVMIYMLLTNRHPCGLTKSKALNKNTSGKVFEKWALSNPIIFFENSEIQNILNGCLASDPNARPNLQNIYQILIHELQVIDESTFSNLKLRFDYYDAFDNAYADENELRGLEQISELPGKRDNAITELIRLLTVNKNRIKTPKDLIIYFETIKSLLRSTKKKALNRDLIMGEALHVIELLETWHENIKVSDRYQPIKVNGSTVIDSPHIWDFEIPCEYIGLALNIIDFLEGQNFTECYFRRNTSPVIQSMYHYCRASDARSKDINLAVEHLENAMSLKPNEPALYYMQHMWIEHSLIGDLVFNRFSSSQKEVLRKKAEMASQILVKLERRP